MLNSIFKEKFFTQEEEDDFNEMVAQAGAFALSQVAGFADSKVIREKIYMKFLLSLASKCIKRIDF